MAKSLVGQLGLACAALAAAVVASQVVRPVYVGRAPVVQRLVEQAWAPTTWQDSTELRAPWTVADGDAAVQSTQYETDRRAFADDLVRTGRIDAARADTIATYAVREAYLKKVPPALVFGVMLAENTTFRSTARSNVGAVGLMQVYGKIWVPTLGKLFGRNLQDDETNLRYGVHILSHYVYRAGTKMADADAAGAVRTGLLRYNGCVRGTNTAGCHRYPDKVMANVERYAVSQCGQTDFAQCVGRPLQLTFAMATPRTASGD
jgi:soluble lytic murein transglycosylase-like protein